MDRGDLVTAEEGCLSLAGVTVDVERPLHARVSGQGLEGERLLIEASGLEARVLQHEIDHLDGILILDRTEREQRRGGAAGPARGRALRSLDARADPPDEGEPSPRRASERIGSAGPERLPRDLGLRRDRPEDPRRLAAPPVASSSPLRTASAAAAASWARRPPPPPPASSASSCIQTRERQRPGLGGRDPRPPARSWACVCAFGQLIGEPLLGGAADAQRAPVAPAPLARRRADRAGDHGRGRADRRLHHAADGRPRLRPGGPARGDRDRRRGRLRRRWPRASPSSAAGCWSRRSTATPPARSTSPSSPRRASPTPRRSKPAERRVDPGRRGAEEARRIRALTPARRRLRRARGRRAARPARPARHAADGPRGGRVRPRSTTASCSAAARAPCAIGSAPAARRALDGRRRLPARPRPSRSASRRRAAVERGRRRPGASPTRRCAASSRTAPGPTGRCAAPPTRPGSRAASAPRRRALAYGAVQRRGTTDHFDRRAGRAPRRAHRRAAARGAPARAATSCSSPTGARRSRRRRSGGRARQGPRRAAPRGRARQRRAPPRRPRARDAPRRPRRRRPGGRRGRPLGAALARRALVGGARRRIRRAVVLAAINEPPERAYRANRLARRSRRGARGARRGRRRGARGADPSRRRRPPTR